MLWVLGSLGGGGEDVLERNAQRGADGGVGKMKPTGRGQMVDA